MNMSRRLIEARVSNVCFWHADIPTVFRDVRFQGNSGHRADVLQCPLLTQRGHEPIHCRVWQLNELRSCDVILKASIPRENSHG